MKYQQTILHLSLISGIGPVTIKLILDKVIDVDAIYKFSIADFIELGLSFDRAQKVVLGLKNRSLLEKELELIVKHQISWCVIGSPEYSHLLAQIEQPPVVIYYQGANLFQFQKSIAFVGSRKADAYARFVVEKLVPNLVLQDWIIVSGGAMGVDSFVHDCTVRYGGKTIVVLGSGLLHWYPLSNSKLFNKIIQSGGMIISCFSLQTQPIAANFPARNRIIAGLSQGTIVVQAARKSGALITADFALEQGRNVFAVPGSIEYGLHDGCHYLIGQGAKLVSSVDDIITEFGYNSIIDNQINHDHNTIDIQMTMPINCIDEQDKIILDKLLVACSTDDLLAYVELSLEDLMQKLFDLSLDGKISQDIMGLWKRI